MTTVGAKLEKKLRTLLDIRNSLASCDSIEAIVSKATRDALVRLGSQTASIFLFDKNGVLRRIWIEGYDSQGRRIENHWFPDEQYRAGESFTGRAVVPVEGSEFGQPQWSNRLESDRPGYSSAGAYKGKLGRLTCAIAVPLSGRHRTFGVLEVINKRGGDEGFSHNNVYWLSVIGNAVATRISQLRQENELRILAEISRLLVQPFSAANQLDVLSEDEGYTQISEKLTSALMYYKACIVRLGQEELVIMGRSGDGVVWDRFDWSPLRLGMYPAGETLAAGKIYKVESIRNTSSLFFNREWIDLNEFEGYVCIPLQIGRKTIGTLSLFTGFPCRFYENDVEFLRNVAFLVATYSESGRVIDELQAVREEIEEKHQEYLSASRMVGYELARQERVHRYKHDYQAAINALKKIRDSDLGVAELREAVAKQVTWLEARLSEIHNELVEAVPSEVNINNLIQSVMPTISRQASGRRIKFAMTLADGLPKLLVRDREVKEILYSLLTNAVRAVREVPRSRGLIEISTAVVQLKGIDYVEIKVRDNGVGISVENVLRIFDRGFSTYKKQGGTGLGLFLTKKIVEDRYSGKILFETEVGEGSAFMVLLPIKRLLPKKGVQ